MIFDQNLLFFHSGTAFGMTNGEYYSLVGTASTTTSTVINLGVQEDMGIGDGEFVPKLALLIGSSGITSTCQSLTINTKFQGSTDSVTWQTYAESGATSTASYQAGFFALPLDIPRRLHPDKLPQYYRVTLTLAGNASSETLTTGSILGGIVIQRSDADDTIVQYPAGFSVS